MCLEDVAVSGHRAGSFRCAAVEDPLACPSSVALGFEVPRLDVDGPARDRGVRDAPDELVR